VLVYLPISVFINCWS